MPFIAFVASTFSCAAFDVSSGVRPRHKTKMAVLTAALQAMAGCCTLKLFAKGKTNTNFSKMKNREREDGATQSK
jgi:hypothetical protein